MYIVTSKPKRISVNSGLVHMVLSNGDDAIAPRMSLRKRYAEPRSEYAGTDNECNWSVTESGARLYGKITIAGSCFS